MIIQPKVRGFICTTAHPAGCQAAVKEQIDYVKAQPHADGPKKVLVIGASMGYGLASRITAAYSFGAATIGVIFDKPAAGNRTASSGWYNTAAFENFAHADGLYAKTINGDAYSQDIKEQTIALIKQDLGQVDLVVYSLAAPRRTMADGTTYSSVLKTVGAPYTNKTIDLKKRVVSDITVEPATEEEIAATVKVMGGEDWKDWMDALKAAGALSEQALTVAYSYIGPDITHPMYADGSIGKAKDHLFATSQQLTAEGIPAYISVNKALVTQSSAAIPIVPLYISILYKVMKAHGNHEGCIEQMYRLMNQKLYNGAAVTDDENRIRLDDLEMLPDIQSEVQALWSTIATENLDTHADIDGYFSDFYRLFGFGLDGVDYEADTDPSVLIPSLM
ncbi:MAG: trans-2-enoyl-CoA reductase family protein [Clostridia bacterium]|nr:trans-2-enoyl-CoA reductase family protein [Clostridia bacterium]HCA54763.1 bifunctional NADH-specific enoyl-ACP reductase/trans-2-enoyl-CoA reductase [Oscillospiraceae bacterium]